MSETQAVSYIRNFGRVERAPNGSDEFHCEQLIDGKICNKPYVVKWRDYLNGYDSSSVISHLKNKHNVKQLSRSEAGKMNGMNSNSKKNVAPQVETLDVSGMLEELKNGTITDNQDIGKRLYDDIMALNNPDDGKMVYCLSNDQSVVYYGSGATGRITEHFMLTSFGDVKKSNGTSNKYHAFYKYRNELSCTVMLCDLGSDVCRVFESVLFEVTGRGETENSNSLSNDVNLRIFSNRLTYEQNVYLAHFIMSNSNREPSELYNECKEKQLLQSLKTHGMNRVVKNDWSFKNEIEANREIDAEILRKFPSPSRPLKRPTTVVQGPVLKKARGKVLGDEIVLN